MADLPLQAGQFKEAGLEVTVTVKGESTEAAVPVDLTAYRIVQEALTNVLKHGGPAARVTIACSPSEVYVEVIDDGREPVGADLGHGTHVPRPRRTCTAIGPAVS